MSKEESKPDIAHVEEARPVEEENELDQEKVSFSDKEKQELTRKIDFRIIPVLIVTYALYFLDKATFGASIIFGSGLDLGLTKVTGFTENQEPILDTTNFSNATMIYYVGFIVGVYPWGVLSQKFPKSKVISVACVIWSAIGIFMVLCKNYTGAMLVRFFLGVCEAAVPGTLTVYITYWYTREQQVTRSAYWYSAGGIGSMVGPVLGWGTAKIKGDLPGWKYMFIVINSISLAWGILIWFILPNSPESAKFLSEKQQAMLIERLRKNQAGNMSKEFNWGQAKEAALDFNVWILILFVTLSAAPVAALSNFSPTVIQGIGFTNDQALLLTTPLGAMTVISLLASAYICRKWSGLRHYATLVLLILELVGALLVWQSPTTNKGARYTGILLFPVVTGAQGMVVSMVSSNIGGNTKKYVTSGAVFIGNCVGSICGSLVFGASPGPRFDAGFIGNTAFTIGCIVLITYSFFALRHENRKRDQAGEFEEVGLDVDITDRKNKAFRYVL